MKKVIILLVALFAAVTLSNAQLYVSGGIGIHSEGGKVIDGSSTDQKESFLTLNVSPMVGFYLSDNFLVGLGIDFGRVSWKDKDDVNVKANASCFGIGPFVRARMIQGGNLSFWMEGAFTFAAVSGKDIDGSSTTEMDPITAIGIGILPVLSYELSNSLYVELSCDFLRLYFNAITEKDKDDANYKDKSNEFGFGLNGSISSSVARDVFGLYSSASPLTLRIAFKF